MMVSTFSSGEKEEEEAEMMSPQAEVTKNILLLFPDPICSAQKEGNFVMAALPSFLPEQQQQQQNNRNRNRNIEAVILHVMTYKALPHHPTFSKTPPTQSIVMCSRQVR